MPCTPFHTPNGAGFICSRGQRPRAKPCVRCRLPSAFLCDHPTDKGTCDRSLCAACRIPTDAEHDYCPEHAPRRVKVWTARIGRVYTGPDVLDITRKTGQEGLFLAPTWEAIRPVLDARREAAECLRGAHRDGAIGALHRATAQEILDRAWAAYRPAFVELMRASWREHRIAWLRLLARETVTLVCYCGETEQCHRTILARELLPKLGATYMGEHGTLALF